MTAVLARYPKEKKKEELPERGGEGKGIFDVNAGPQEEKVSARMRGLQLCC